MPDKMREAFDGLREAQAGVVTRQQALDAGISDEVLRSSVRSGRWQRLHPGIYWTYSGPQPRSTLLSAALLRAGRGAVLSHETAAELCGLVDTPSDPIHVSVPQTRRVTRTAGIRERLCWREALVMAVSDVGAGCHSMLELRYLRDVERAHGLPSGSRQRKRTSGAARTYSDVEYEGFALVVELDGRVAHEGAAWLRDQRRDNRATAGGRMTLRYGWADVNVRPGRTAAETAAALKAGGWRGAPTRCGSSCTIFSTT